MRTTLIFRITSLVLFLFFSQSLAEEPVKKNAAPLVSPELQAKSDLSEIALPSVDLANPKPDATRTTEQAAKAESTEINSRASTFNNDTHIAIFTDNVTVKNPEFNVICDKLTATLHHGPQANPKRTYATPLGLPAASASPESAERKGGLQKALAESNPGQIVTITQDKVNPDGSVKHSVGHSRKAFYDAETGDILLSGGKPDMKQDENLMVALEDRTILILNRDGRTRSVGPSKTYIIQSSPNKKEPSKANAVGP